MIEAAACARPIITTDVPGCREIVHHNDNGLLVPARNAAALAAALKQLIEDGALRRRMGGRGRQRAEEEYSDQRVAREHLAVYRALLVSRRTQRGNIGCKLPGSAARLSSSLDPEALDGPKSEALRPGK